MRKNFLAPLSFVLAAASPALAQPAPPEAVFVNGKVVTVDADFSVREAFAVRGGKIVATGSSREMRALARDGVTTVRDLGGRTVLPGLIDSHVHAPAAAVFEFDHEIPEMETIRDVLDYIAARAKALEDGAAAVIQAEREATGNRPGARVTQRELDLQDGIVVHLVGALYRAFREGAAVMPGMVVPPLGEVARFFDRAVSRAQAASPTPAKPAGTP